MQRRKYDVKCTDLHEKLWDKWMLESTIFNEYQKVLDANKNGKYYKSQVDETRVRINYKIEKSAA